MSLQAGPHLTVSCTHTHKGARETWYTLLMGGGNRQRNTNKDKEEARRHGCWTISNIQICIWCLFFFLWLVYLTLCCYSKCYPLIFVRHWKIKEIFEKKEKYSNIMGMEIHSTHLLDLSNLQCLLLRNNLYAHIKQSDYLLLLFRHF